MADKLAVALIHHPVLDRTGREVATNITHFDIHDIARVCRVYGVDRYYVIHPAKEQLMFVARVLDHWRVGPGKHFNPMRKTALTMVKPVESLQWAIGDFERFTNKENTEKRSRLRVIATSARDKNGSRKLDFGEVRRFLNKEDVLLVFGTGFGLFPGIFNICDACLEPIRGYGIEDYRHLSVRSAVSICLDRLRGSFI